MTDKELQQIAEMAEKFSGDGIFFTDAVVIILERLAAEIKFSMRFGKTMIKLYTLESNMLFAEILFRKSWGHCIAICFCSDNELSDESIVQAHLPPKAEEGLKAYKISINTLDQLDNQLHNWLIYSYKIRV